MKNSILKVSGSKSDKHFTRREFLRTTASIGGLLLLNLWDYGFASAFGRLSDHNSSGQVLRDGGLLFLPDHGTLFVASDFHTRYADFQMWLERTRIVERLRNGDDVYGLIVGDVVDRKPGDIHAGPSRSLSCPKDIISKSETVVQEILWSRRREQAS